MAVTALLAVSPSVVTAGQVINVRFVLTNSAGGTVVNVLRLTPYVTGTNTVASASFGNFNPTIGTSTLLGVSATATTSLGFNSAVTIAAPASPLNPPYPNSPAYDTYTIGVLADMSDGTVQSSSSSVEVYPLIADNTGAMTIMPQPGQFRLDQNTESALIGALYMP